MNETEREQAQRVVEARRARIVELEDELRELRRNAYLREQALEVRARVAELEAERDKAVADLALPNATGEWSCCRDAEARLAAVIALCDEDGIEWALGTIGPDAVRAAATGEQQ